MKSIMQNKKECWFCGKQYCLHLHHVYGGPNRKTSDKNGFTVYLCAYHHNLGGNGKCVHQSKDMDLVLKQDCQRIYEQGHTRDEFMALIGRNYL